MRIMLAEADSITVWSWRSLRVCYLRVTGFDFWLLGVSRVQEEGGVWLSYAAIDQEEMTEVLQQEHTLARAFR